jgi:hypothetical protein
MAKKMNAYMKALQKARKSGAKKPVKAVQVALVTMVKHIKRQKQKREW